MVEGYFKIYFKIESKEFIEHWKPYWCQFFV